MSIHTSHNNDYEGSDENFYRLFENANGLTTNNIAYDVVGYITYKSVRATFAHDPILYICDVGCYLGGSSARWHRQGGGSIRVLGVDIHMTNIQAARASHQHIENLSFQHMERNSAIPLLEERGYHAIFATFVLDTISQFEDVAQLCRNMVTALLPGGEITLLRLHPRSLSYKGEKPFREYIFNSKPVWSHGDPLRIQLTNDVGETIVIDDHYWQPEIIADVFREEGCHVTLFDLRLESDAVVVEALEKHIQASNAQHDMPEWSVPLYQIIQVKKHF
jgi:SAM-dependent methyltransferase